MFLDKRFWTDEGSRGRGFVAAKWLVVFCAWLSLVTLQRGRAAAQEPPTGVAGKPSQQAPGARYAYVRRPRKQPHLRSPGSDFFGLLAARLFLFTGAVKELQLSPEQERKLREISAWYQAEIRRRRRVEASDAVSGREESETSRGNGKISPS